jgi:hypothetical protein
MIKRDKRPAQKRYSERRKDGFSVLFVLSIGLVVLMGVMAVTDALVTAQRNVATQVYMNECVSAAENSLQYAMCYINAAAASGTLSTVSSPILIPNQISGNAKVTVTLAQIPSPLVTNPTFTPIWNPSVFPGGLTVQNPPIYLLLSAQSQEGTFQRTINVVLGQTFPTAPSPQKTPTTAYFSGALFGNQSVIVNGVNVLFENSYTPSAASYAQNIVSSNSLVQLSGTTTLAGSLSASSIAVPAMTNPQGVPTSSITIDGNVSYTGSNIYTPNYFIVDPGTATPTPGANILGDGLSGGLGNQPGSITNNAAQSTTSAATVQAASSAAPMTSTGPVGSQTTVVAAPSAAAPVENLGTLNPTGSDSVTIPSGQYVASSISTTPNSTLNLNLSTNSAGAVNPVQIYLQGDSVNGTSLQLQGNVNMPSATQSASNLQFFYNGTQPLSVTMGAQNPNFYGQIYAPNANVTVDTTGGAFHGSVVANNLTVQGSGTFYYDPRSVNPAGGGPGAAGPGYTPAANAASASSLYVLSWQEQTTGAP